jgi:putative thiazole/oxazole-modified microcin (TOMM)-like peptide
MAESIYILGDEDRRKFARLVAAAWEDGELRGRYEIEPRAVLSRYGIAYPQGVPTPPLPPKPDGEFDIADLESAAGSSAPSTVSTVATLTSMCGPSVPSTVGDPT